MSPWADVLTRTRSLSPRRGARVFSGCCGIVAAVSLVLVLAIVHLILADPRTVADTVSRADSTLVHTLAIVLVAIAKSLMTYASAVL